MPTRLMATVKSRLCGLNLQKNFMTVKAKFTAFIVGTKSLCSGGEILEIKSGKYAVFSFPCEPHNVAKFWGEIWKYFESSKLRRAYETDFEKYLNEKIEIYISIK